MRPGSPSLGPMSVGSTRDLPGLLSVWTGSGGGIPGEGEEVKYQRLLLPSPTSIRLRCHSRFGWFAAALATPQVMLATLR